MRTRSSFVLSPRRITGIACALFVLSLVASAIAGSSAEGSSEMLTDRLAKRIVLVRDLEGNPVEGAVVTVDYVSHPNPPTFRTDAAGRADVLVQKGFWELKVEYCGLIVGLRGQTDRIVWPVEIRLPLKCPATQGEPRAK